MYSVEPLCESTVIDLLTLSEGHSWGGRLAPAFAAGRPQGLQKLIIASGIASTETTNRGNQLNRNGLPDYVRLALDEEEQQGNFESQRFKDTLAIFHREYFYRGEPPPPPELIMAGKNMAQDNAARMTM